MQKYFLIALISILGFACNQSAQKEELVGYEIDGTISGAENQMVFIKEYKDGKLQTVDSLTIDSAAHFQFKGEVEVPVVRYIEVSEERFELFLENSKISFSAKLGELDKAEVKGSKSHDELLAYHKATDSFRVRMDTLEAQYGKAVEAKNTAKITQLDADYEAIMAEKSVFVIDYVKKNSKSFASPYIVRSELVYSLSLAQLSEIVSAFDSTIYKSDYYIFLKERVEVLTKVEIGQDFTDFTQNDSLGKPFSLSSLKGKVILVDFWASWCGPCRRANPDVVKIYKKYHAKGFEILGVSFDKSRADWIAAVKKDGLTWNHVSDLQGWGNAAGKLYGIMSIPHTVLIDKQGKIVAKNLGKDELDAKIAELLAVK